MTTYKKKTYEAPSVSVIAMESSECQMQVLTGSTGSLQMSEEEFVDNESSVLSTGSSRWQEFDEDDF